MNLQTVEGGSFVCPDDPGEPTTNRRRVSVTEEEATVLGELARDRVVVEIGTGLGVSTRAMARTARWVYTNDCDPWVWENVHRGLPPNTIGQYHRGEYEEPIDMVFIDGDHATAAVDADIAYAASICKRGVIVCHDAKMESVDLALRVSGPWARYDTHHGLAIKVI